MSPRTNPSPTSKGLRQMNQNVPGFARLSYIPGVFVEAQLQATIPARCVNSPQYDIQLVYGNREGQHGGRGGYVVNENEPRHDQELKINQAKSSGTVRSRHLERKCARGFL